jgi:hypothetical protein
VWFDGEGGPSVTDEPGGFGMRGGGDPGARGGVDVAGTRDGAGGSGARDDVGGSGARDDMGGSGVTRYSGARGKTSETLAVSSPVTVKVDGIDPLLLKRAQSDGAGTVY